MRDKLINEFFEELEKQKATDDTFIEAITYIFMYVYAFYEKEEYSFINELLQKVDTEKTELSILLGFLNIAAQRKEELPFYKQFYNTVKLLVEKEDPEDAEKIMSGF